MTLGNWDEARLKRLKRLNAEKKSAGEIAAALGTTRSAIIGKMARLKLPLAGSSETTRELGRQRRGRQQRQQVSSGTAASEVVPAFQTPTPPRRFTWETALDASPEHD